MGHSRGETPCADWPRRDESILVRQDCARIHQVLQVDADRRPRAAEAQDLGDAEIKLFAPVAIRRAGRDQVDRHGKRACWKWKRCGADGSPHSLITLPEADTCAQRAGFQRLSRVDLTSNLDCGRPRDVLVAIGRHLPLPGYWWRSLVGDSALQSAPVAGLIEFRFIVWRKRSRSAIFSYGRTSP